MLLNIMAAFAAISSGLIAFGDKEGKPKDIKVKRAPVDPGRQNGNGNININKAQTQQR